VSAPVLFAADEPGGLVECASTVCDATGVRPAETDPPAGWRRLTVDGIGVGALTPLGRYGIAGSLHGGPGRLSSYRSRGPPRPQWIIHCGLSERTTPLAVRRAVVSTGVLVTLLTAMGAKGGCDTGTNPCMEKAAYTVDTVAASKCSTKAWKYHVHITWQGISRVAINAGRAVRQRSSRGRRANRHTITPTPRQAFSQVVAQVFPDDNARIFNRADTDCTMTIPDENGRLVETIHHHSLPGGHKHPQMADCSYPD
jgi:hypothetical protein